MTDRYDAVIVGARVAGSPLARKLAQEGLKVAVVDRASFPSDTLSTHIVQAEAPRILQGLGLLDRVLATGAPMLQRAEMRVDGLYVNHPLPRRPGEPGAGLSVRRHVLDTILVEGAAEAGADIRTSTRVVGLEERNGRVTGVRVSANGHESTLETPLVIGADGRGSIVARLTGARAYNLVPNQRATFWAYYEGTTWSGPPTIQFHRWENQFVLGCPGDGGLYQVIILPELDEVPEFRSDLEGAFDTHLARCEPVADIVAGARRIARPQQMLRWTGYLRESAGPGWALIGDAGHFKDPAPGQGITDAFRQAEKLAPEIVAGLDGGDIDARTTAWWRWRDKDAAEKAWFATDLGSAGPVPPVLVEILTDLTNKQRLDDWFNIFNHRIRPSKVLTPPRLVKATARLLHRGEHPRREVLAVTRHIIAEDMKRKRLNKKPAFAGANDLTGGATDIPFGHGAGVPEPTSEAPQRLAG